MHPCVEVLVVFVTTPLHKSLDHPTVALLINEWVHRPYSVVFADQRIPPTEKVYFHSSFPISVEAVPHLTQLELSLKLVSILLELPDTPFVEKERLADVCLVQFGNAPVYSNQCYRVAGNFEPSQEGIFSSSLVICFKHLFQLINSPKFDKVANYSSLHPVECNLLIPSDDLLHSFLKVSRCTQLNMH